MARKRTRTKNPRYKGVCAKCGLTRSIQMHHYPIPKSEGGKDVIPMCAKCHKRYHSVNGEFAKWGQKGGKTTVEKHPEIWKNNLKQFRKTAS